MSTIKNKIKNVISLMKRKEKVPIIVPVANEKLLQNKVILISGGSGGLGSAMAKYMAKCGATVIIGGTNKEKLEQICTKEDRISYIVLNLKDISSFERKIESIGKDIDILINCAGINSGEPFFSVSEKTFDDIISVNLKGAYFLSQIVAKKMIEKGIKGHILNVSSASALRPASAPYAISKWAVNGMTKGLADVLIPYGIVVNAIAPGPTATEMLNKSVNDEISHDASPIGRYATVQEISNLAVFMVSNMGDLIVGDTYYISGGSGTISLHR